MAVTKNPRKNQKYLIPVVILLVLGLAAGVFYFGVSLLTKGDDGYHGPAAKLGGETVSDQEFNQKLYQVMQQANNDSPEVPTIAEVLDRALTLSIKDLALSQEIKKAGSKIKVSNADVDQYIQRRWPTEEEVESAMQQTGISSKTELKQAIRKNLETLQFLLYKARQLKMTVTKEEVLERLERITTSHILISTLDQQTYRQIRTPAEALKRAGEVYQKATGGIDFSELVQQYSDDPETKEQGGSAGAKPLDRFKQTMPQEYVDAALTLKPDEISKPVEVKMLKLNENGHPVNTIIGYYIIKFISREIPRGAEYSVQYQKAAEDLLIQKTQEPDSPYAVWENANLQKALQQMEILDPFLRGYRLLQAQKWVESALAFEKALTIKYYQNHRETYLYVAKAYSNVKEPRKAIQIMEKAAEQFKDLVDYQVTLAKLYKENHQPEKAAETLVKLSANHMAIASEAQIHQKIKEIYLEWNMQKDAAKEETIIEMLKGKE